MAVLALAAAVIWLALRLRKAEARYRTLVEGTDGGNLEALLTEHMAQVRDGADRVVELDELARRLERASRVICSGSAFCASIHSTMRAAIRALPSR